MSSAYSVLIPAGSPTPAFIFDLDGTLIDSVYQHVLAWRDSKASDCHSRCGEFTGASE